MILLFLPNYESMIRIQLLRLSFAYKSNNGPNFTHAVKLKTLVPGLAYLLLVASETANSNKYCRIISGLLVNFQNHIVRYYYSICHIFEPYNTEKLSWYWPGCFFSSCCFHRAWESYECYKEINVFIEHTHLWILWDTVIAVLERHAH